MIIISILIYRPSFKLTDDAFMNNCYRHCMSSQSFLLGVIEGFYGRPWTFEQRKRLFVRERGFGFKYFMYAPKDETKHRRLWRELHDEIELFYLKELINSASEQNIDFVYAISPGLDMVYSSEQELTLLEKKLKQIFDIGCRHFALLFDDIDTHFHCSLDLKQFSSLAKAQVHVSNKIHEKFTDCSFMFCPTEYCTSRAYPTVEDSEYLQTVGTDLNESFYVLWTGERVISDELTAEHINPVRKALKRKPLIWENLHANDYDPRRVFLGPYLGREPKLRHEIAGILTNPNNQFELNYIPLLSLSLWFTNAQSRDDENEYRQSICRVCCEKWVTEVCRQLPCEESLVVQMAAVAGLSAVANSDTSIPAAEATTSQSESEASKNKPTTNSINVTTIPLSAAVPGVGEIDPTYSISVEQIELIVSFNYLPHKAGPQAQALLDEARYLADTSACSPGASEGSTGAKGVEAWWRERACALVDEAEKVVGAIDRLLDCPNRQVAMEIYPMLSETRVIMGMLTTHFNYLLGEDSALSEEKRLGFCSRFGINGHFNNLLTNIMQTNSSTYTTPTDESGLISMQIDGSSGDNGKKPGLYSGGSNSANQLQFGVMVLPIAQHFVPKAALFLKQYFSVSSATKSLEGPTEEEMGSNGIGHLQGGLKTIQIDDKCDLEMWETLVRVAVEQSTVLCYVMVSEQDQILAVSLGFHSVCAMKLTSEKLMAERASFNANYGDKAMDVESNSTDDSSKPSSESSGERVEKSTEKVEGKECRTTGNENEELMCEPDVKSKGCNEIESCSSCKQFVSNLISMAESIEMNNHASDITTERSEGCCCVLVMGPYGEAATCTINSQTPPQQQLVSSKMLHNFLLSVDTATRATLTSENAKRSLLIPSLVNKSMAPGQVSESGLMTSHLMDSLCSLGYTKSMVKIGEDGSCDCAFDLFHSSTSGIRGQSTSVSSDVKLSGEDPMTHSKMEEGETEKGVNDDKGDQSEDDDDSQSETVDIQS